MHGLMSESLVSYVHLHFVVYDERIRVRAEFGRACSEQKLIWTPLIGHCIHKLNRFAFDWL